MNRPLIIVLLSVLGLGVFVQWRKLTPEDAGRGVHLARIIPAEVRGWTSAALQLGPSEAGSAAVENVLRFDDVFYREYRDRTGRSFALYVAYWNPGKMPVQVVASHTPDRCWQENGWTCTATDYHVVLHEGRGLLKEGQGREFRDPQGGIQHVIYWHVIGDRLFDFGERINRIPNPLKWWREVMRQMVSRPQGQYFIRLSSGRPLRELEDDEGFQAVLQSLGSLGIERS